MLITKVSGTPLNLGSTSLVFPSSPSLDPGLEPGTWGLAAWVYIPALPLLAMWPQGHLLTSLSHLLICKTKIIKIGPILMRLLWRLSEIILVKHFKQGLTPVLAVSMMLSPHCPRVQWAQQATDYWDGLCHFCFLKEHHLLAANECEGLTHPTMGTIPLLELLLKMLPVTIVSVPYGVISFFSNLKLKKKAYFPGTMRII